MAQPLEKMEESEAAHGPDGPDQVELEFEPKRKLTGVKWFFFNISTLTAIFLYSLDNTVVGNIQPEIVSRYDAVDKLPWLSVGLMIGGLSMVMPLGNLYAQYDGKILFIFFAVNFMAASALCGGAPNMTAEISGRIWAGAGGNGMYYGLLNLVSVNTLEQECPTYLSLTVMVWGLGAVLGPVIGGAFELYTWRWVFYINLLFGAIVFHLTSSSFRPTIPPRPIGAVITLIVAINFGGDGHAWNSGTIIALFVVSGILWIILALQQTFTIFTKVENRMLPVHLLRNKQTILLSILAACGGSIAYVTVYYIPLYYQFTHGDSAIKTAERILPFIFLLIFGMLSNGYLMSKFGWYKPWYCARWRCLDDSAIYGYQALIGLGAGSFAHAGYAVIQATVDPKDGVYGVTFIMLGQLSGLAIGLSLNGALFINLAKKNLRAVFPSLDESTLISIVPGSSGGFLDTQTEAKRTQALGAIVDALENVFTEVYTVAALAVVLSIFLKWKKLRLAAGAGGISS
ncbi:MFS general substrate transporter [Penicillium malachiteum]|nr:MFS general substrate transporter [Penicillium malachiteum]